MRVDLDTSPPPLSGRDGPRRIPGGVIRPGTWLHLLRALNDLAGGAGELRDHAERAWASATFTGSRHAFTIDFTGLAATDGAVTLSTGSLVAGDRFWQGAGGRDGSAGLARWSGGVAGSRTRAVAA